MLELFIGGTHIPVQVDRWTVNERRSGEKVSITIPFTVTATAASARTLYDANLCMRTVMLRISDGPYGTEYIGMIVRCFVVTSRHGTLMMDAELLVSEWPTAVERSRDAVLIGGM